MHLWQPSAGGKVSLDEIERAILKLHATFKLHCLACDPWQAALLIERLNKQGVPTVACDQTPNNLKAMASSMLEAFTEGTIELFRHDALLADLRALRVKEQSYGVRLESPRNTQGGTKHGDTATALALALMAAKRLNMAAAHERTRARELVVWPAL